MYAVIKTGGKQYRVEKDAVLKLERLPGAAGDSITFGEVLLVGGENGTSIGSPLVAGASVTAEVLEQMRGPKIIVFKKRRRKHYRRKNGHRQELTVVRVTGISAGA
jgi:large subunit ribosomal protein L21